jgi:hypothetical protein
MDNVKTLQNLLQGTEKNKNFYKDTESHALKHVPTKQKALMIDITLQVSRRIQGGLARMVEFIKPSFLIHSHPFPQILPC